MAAPEIAATPSVTTEQVRPPSATRTTIRELLLIGGILSSLLYVTMLVFVPLLWEAYSSASQTVSELSAIDAPTRTLWVSLGILWASLYAGFGWGVWQSAGSNRG